MEETPPPKPAVAAPKDEALPDFPITKYELPEEEAVEELGPQEDESVSAQQEALPEQEGSVGETTEYPDDQQEQSAAESAEVEDLGPLPDESGTVTYPEDQRTAENTVGEPTAYPDEKAAPAPVTPKSVSVSFEAEPLFSFDKFAIRADQREKLDEFITSLYGTRYDSIQVVGHADRIGTEAYNQKLSERRAESVKAYLGSKGIEVHKIQTEGRGESDPVTGDACNKARGKNLISCLQPDRRVDVSVSATKQAN
ncbi:MAG TPA: OmpA family protein [Burkholderiales bacterium]